MKRSILSLILVLLLSGSFTACTHPAPKANSDTRPGTLPRVVEVISLQPRLLNKTITLPGELSPYESVEIIPKVQGFLDQVHVDRGDAVRRGQVIAHLVSPELENQIAEARAKVIALQSDVTEATAKFQSDQKYYQRLKEAAATPGAISENELYTAQKNMEAAQAKVGSLTNSVHSAQSAVSATEAMNNYLTLVSPINGVVTERTLHPGALVGPNSGTPVVKLETRSPLRLTVPVPERYDTTIENGKVISFTIAALPNQLFTAKVHRQAYAFNPKNRTESVELDVDNSQGIFKPGMYAEVLWPAGRPVPSFVVPAKAVVSTTDRTFVIRVRNGTAQWVDVKPGEISGEDMEVFGPLQPQDEIVAQATDEIREGIMLNPKPYKSIQKGP